MIVRTFGSIGKRLREQCIWPVCLFLLLGLSHSALATPLTAWNFAGAKGNEPSSNATFVATGFQTTELTRGGFHDPILLDDTIANGSWRFDDNINFDNDGYFEFSISPQPGTMYSLKSIVFDLLTNPNGPNTWRLTTGTGAKLDQWDAFPNADPNIALPPTPSTHTSILLPSVDFQDLTSDRIFRLYGFNQTGTGAGGRGAGISSLSINGSTSVPEALPFGAFGLTAGLLLFVRSRVKE
jgi:hypothetical protein